MKKHALELLTSFASILKFSRKSRHSEFPSYNFYSTEQRCKVLVCFSNRFATLKEPGFDSWTSSMRPGMGKATSDFTADWPSSKSLQSFKYNLNCYYRDISVEIFTI